MLVAQGVVLPAVLAILCTQLAILIDIRWGWRGILRRMRSSAAKSSIRRFVITEKAPTRAFSWLKAATTAFTFKTLLRHYA